MSNGYEVVYSLVSDHRLRGTNYFFVVISAFPCYFVAFCQRFKYMEYMDKLSLQNFKLHHYTVSGCSSDYV